MHGGKARDNGEENRFWLYVRKKLFLSEDDQERVMERVCMVSVFRGFQDSANPQKPHSCSCCEQEVKLDISSSPLQHELSCDSMMLVLLNQK